MQLRVARQSLGDWSQDYGKCPFSGADKPPQVCQGCRSGGRGQHRRSSVGVDLPGTSVPMDELLEHSTTRHYITSDEITSHAFPFT